MMNRLRLFEPFSLEDYQVRTGLHTASVLSTLEQAKTKGLMSNKDQLWQVTKQGHRYLNSLLEMFL